VTTVLLVAPASASARGETVKREGYFLGTIRFRGERGTPRSTPPVPQAKSSRRRRKSASARSSTTTPSPNPKKMRLGSSPTRDPTGGRWGFPRALHTPFTTGDFPTSATVTPPDPFQGSAVFQRNSGADSAFTGSL